MILKYFPVSYVEWHCWESLGYLSFASAFVDSSVLWSLLLDWVSITDSTTNWRRPHHSQSRVRERLVYLLATLGQRVGVMKSPSVRVVFPSTQSSHCTHSVSQRCAFIYICEHKLISNMFADIEMNKTLSIFEGEFFGHGKYAAISTFTQSLYVDR